MFDAAPLYAQRKMRVLIGCECSGVVRRAFAALGHDVTSCDLKPAEDGSNHHIICDVRDLLHKGWDLLAVMHPPCTRLCNSGVRWLSKPPGKLPLHYAEAIRLRYAQWDEERRLQMMWDDLRDGTALFSDCWNAPIERVAVENPVMHKHAKKLIRGFERHAQSVQPWQFGTEKDGPDNVKKRTCLWLRGLPVLTPTGTLDGTTARDEIHSASPGKNRAAYRARFFPGLAAAMAEQWGGYAVEAMAA
tara:strand:- start:8465 stop:9202 length:738 start_codon:yes stop_codon:yes gene_type:complete